MTNEQWEKAYQDLRERVSKALHQVAIAQMECRNDKDFEHLVKIDNTLSGALYGSTVDTDA